ncbi:MAG: aminotransferase class V-fold PLP-dependent enzyme, partial [Planctomycetota bacterium]
MLLDTDRIRRDFPVLNQTAASGAPLAFLDNAASSQRPVQVIDAMSRCYREYYANVHRGIHTLSEASTSAYENARSTTQSFLGARSTAEVIFTAGTTAGINLVAHAWGNQNVSSDDVILLTIAEHHANIVPWHQLAERTGCRVEFLPLGDDFCIGDDVVSEALDRLSPKLFGFV